MKLRKNRLILFVLVIQNFLFGQDYSDHSTHDIIGYSAIRLGGDFPLLSDEFDYAHLMYEQGIKDRVYGIGLLLSGQKNEKADVDEDSDTAYYNSAGILLKYGVCNFQSFFGYSMWTGLGIVPGGKYVKASVPVIVEGNFRLYSLIGFYLHAGVILDHKFLFSPSIGFGIMIVPKAKRDFGGFE